MRINIRALREKRGMSRAELAKRAYVSVSTLYSWERGRNMPSLVTAACLARALGVPIDALIEMDGGEEETADGKNAVSG